MDSHDPRGIQAPLRDRYREDPEHARITLEATGELSGGGVSCPVDPGRLFR